MLLKEISWLHTNLPYPLLKLWGASDKVVNLTRKLAFGGDGYKEKYRQLLEMEGWPLDRIYAWQYDKLRKLLDHAYENVPFYGELWRKAGIKPADIKSLSDIRKLPVITKDDLYENEGRFFASNIDPKSLIPKYSSGTTGRPGRFYYDERRLASVWATYLYFGKMMGFVQGKDKALRISLFGKEMFMITNSHLRFSDYSPLLKHALFPPMPVEKAFRVYVKFIKKHGIRYIEGHPSVLYAFSKYAAEENERITFDTARTGGEVLYGFQRRSIEKVFGCEVFDSYGTSEAVIRANECHAHKGMHISPFGIGEVLEGGFSGRGEFVFTGLENYGFPLIRFNVKDVVRISTRTCTCGRTYPRIMDVVGRKNDFVVLPDGEQLPPSQFAWLSVIIPGIKDIFFLQHRDFSIDVLVVGEKGADKNSMKGRIEKKMRRILKGETSFEIIFKEHKERKGLKYTRIESRAVQSK